MATLKLNKKRPTARPTDERKPLRPLGLKRAHPTLAEARAETPPAGPRPQRNEPRRAPHGDTGPRRPDEARGPGRNLQHDPRHERRHDPKRDPRRGAGQDPRAARPPAERVASDERPARERREAAPGQPPREWQPPRDAAGRPDARAEPQRHGRPNGPVGDRRTTAPRHAAEPAARDDRPTAQDPRARPPSPRVERRPYIAPVRAVPRVSRVAPAALSEAIEASEAVEAIKAVEALAPATELPRLSKRMSELGLASRREADDWIERGLVSVDGVVVDQLGTRVSPSQHISVDPLARTEQSRRVTILLNKPLGIVSGQAEDGHLPAVTLIQAASRWAGDSHPQRFHASQLSHLVPAGRLDIDSTGLLVLTQDGRIAKALIGADTEVEKEYVVRVAWAEQPEVTELNKVFPIEQLELMRNGLVLDGQKLKPAKVSWANDRHLRFVLREGKRRQIRRMCEAVGLQVLELKRIRIGRIALGEVPPGQWRYLGPFEKF